MTYLMSEEVTKSVSSVTLSELEGLPLNKQQAFQEDFLKNKKNMVVAYILAICLGAHFIYLGKTGLQIAFWLLMAGFGIWYLIELFLVPKRVKEYNLNLEFRLMATLKK